MSPLKAEEPSLSTQTEHKAMTAHEDSVVEVTNGKMVTNIYHEVGKIGGLSTYFVLH